MATTLDELSVKFTADTAGLRTALERVEIATLKMAATTERATSRMGKAFSTVGRFISAGAIIGGIATLLRLEAALEADADALDDVAKRANIGVEALQRLRIVANESGASAGAMDEALIKLQKSLGAARTGSEQLKNVFAALGLSKLVTEAASTEEAAYALADAISQIKDKAVAAKIITELLGKQGDELIGVFEDGGDALRSYAAAVEESRIRNEALNAKLAESYDRTKKNYEKLTEFGAWLSGVFIDVLDGVVSAINSLIDAWNRAAQAVAEYLKYSGMVNAPAVTTSPGATDVAKSQFVRGGRGLLAPEAALSAPSFAAGTASPFFTGVNEGALGSINAPKGGGGGRDRAAEEAKRAAEQYRDAVSDLTFEIEQLGRAEQEAAYQQELRSALSSAGVTLESERGRAIEELVGQLTSAQQASAALAASWEVDAFRVNQALEQLRQEAEEFAETWDRIGDQIESAFVDTFTDIVSGAADAEEAFKRLIAQVLELIAQQLILQAIQGATGGGGVGAGIGGALANLFRADGGPVNRNTPYIVGERGPELFVPNMNGGIVPNGRVGGGGGSFVYAPTLNAPGADASTLATMRTMLAHQKQDILSMMPKVIKENTARGRLN